MCDDDLWDDYSNAITAIEKRLKIETSEEILRELRDLRRHFKDMQDKKYNQTGTDLVPQPPTRLPTKLPQDKRRKRQGVDLGISARLGRYELETRIKVQRKRK